MIQSTRPKNSRHATGTMSEGLPPGHHGPRRGPPVSRIARGLADTPSEELPHGRHGEPREEPLSRLARGRTGPTPRGITLLEILVAVGILAFGMVPIFMTFSETRLVTTSSLNEMRATGMASSMIDGLMRLPTHLFDPERNIGLVAGFTDEELPPEIGLATLGVPLAYRGLQRHVRVGLVNAPLLPAERFSNPWGKVAEITVTITLKTPGAAPSGAGQGKPVLVMKGYRELAVTP